MQKQARIRKYGIFAIIGPNKAVEIYTSYNDGYDGENESYTELDALYDDEEEYLNFVRKTGVKIEQEELNGI